MFLLIVLSDDLRVSPFIFLSARAEPDRRGGLETLPDRRMIFMNESARQQKR
jgi:hypothetical protein